MKKLLLSLLLFSFFNTFANANTDTDPVQTETSCFTFPSVVGDRTLYDGCPDSEDVESLQICGYELGLNSDPLPGNKPNIDKRFRWRTKNLTMRIQERAGLPVTGIFDAETARALEGMCCGITKESLTAKYGIRGARLDRIFAHVGSPLDVVSERISKLEAKIPETEKLRDIIESTRNENDSLKNLLFINQQNADNRKERDLIDTMRANILALTKQVNLLTTIILKKSLEQQDDSVAEVDTIKKTHLIAYNFGGELYSQVRGSDKTYRPADHAINIGVAVTPFRSNNDAITMNATLGSNFMYERFVDQKAFTGTVGYRKQFQNPSSSFEVRGGYFTRMGEAGTVLASSYEGKPFLKKNDADAKKHDISGITIGASAFLRLAKTEWAQVLQVKAMYPLWDDNARIGIHYLGHREEGLMKKGGFLSDACHVFSLRAEVAPRIKTYNSQYTYQPKLFIQYGSDLGNFGNYNVFSIGADFGRIISQFHNTKVKPHQTQNNMIKYF